MKKLEVTKEELWALELFVDYGWNGFVGYAQEQVEKALRLVTSLQRKLSKCFDEQTMTG